MTEQPKVEEPKKPELTKEEISNIITVLASFKGYTIQEAAYMNGVIGKLQAMTK